MNSAPPAEGGGEQEQQQQQQQGDPGAGDPSQHDWPQVAAVVRQTIWHAERAPGGPMQAEALCVMGHVLQCVEALR